ncbi:MAG: LysR family transcriptional regulator [Candidatus Hydrogenedentota bacterium]|nr:MAG: LysR family transcriptional regulator [Candidatus Hydrogenedentota bacterium]
MRIALSFTLYHTFRAGERFGWTFLTVLCRFVIIPRANPVEEDALDRFAHFLNRRIEVRSKVWLEAGGLPLIGSGRADLLRAVERTGSINAAAKQLGMDYRRAWGLIDSMEKRLNFKLVARRRGGADRGTSLTDEARRLLALYEAFEQQSQKSTDRQFRNTFRPQQKENKE